MDYNFLKTSDKETAEKLRDCNFQEIPSKEPGVYIFLNRNEMQYSSDVNMAKLHYSNTLCI